VTASAGIVVNSGASIGGVVAYPVPPEAPALAAGWKITVMRDMDFKQNTDLVTGSRYLSEVIEERLDRLTAQDQQLREKLGRAVTVPVSSDETPEELVDGLFYARDTAVEKASEASASVQEADASEAAAAQSAAESEGSAELSRKWAENPEDQAVVAGQYSSLHWAKKSQQAAAESERLKEEIESVQGVVTYLDGHDFGDPAESDDWQQTLTDYALAQVPEWETVPNSCDVVNLWDGHEWIYNTETERWIEWGSATVTEATSESAGIVKADVAATPGTVVLRDANGNAQISVPVTGEDIANKEYVDIRYAGTEFNTHKLWTDGKPIFGVIIPLGAGPAANQTKTIPYDFSFVETFISIWAMENFGDGASYIQSPSLRDQITIHTYDRILIIAANMDRSGGVSTATIEYTKKD
jgi:hypothetical protein